MRLLFPIAIVLLALVLIGFGVTNLGTYVTVTIWATEYPNVHIFYVVSIAVLVGALFSGIIAVVEGAKIRLDNRRLRRELHKQETEINYLRTQPPASSKLEPDEVQKPKPPAPATGERKRARKHVPSAPVYGTNDEEDYPPSSDDDIYSGGRAV
jgi:uncharacterized membrane protein YciS (DUF1049 family)